MRAFVLAAGLGTRIRPLFPDLPKSLIPIRGKPFIHWQIQRLADQGFRDVVVCIGYRAAQIKEYCKDGSRWGVSLQYSEEHEPQGTATTLQSARALLSSVSLVLNGDTHLPADYRALVNDHTKEAEARETIASIALVSKPKHEGSGRVMLDAHDRITTFMEKASDQEQGLVNAGAYVVEPAILHSIPSGPSSLERDIFPQLAQSGLLHGITLSCDFTDIGTPEGYAALESAL